MDKPGRKFVAILAGIALMIGGIPSAWASEEQDAIVAERSFQQISRTAPLVTLDASHGSDKVIPNVQIVSSADEQCAAMGIGDGLPLDFEVDSADVEHALKRSLSADMEMREPMNASSVASNSIFALPDVDYGPFSISASRDQSFIVEVTEPSLFAFVLGKRASSSQEDSVHVVLSREDGVVNSEWDVDHAVEAHDYGGFFLDSGAWTIRLSTPGNVDHVQFYYLLKDVSQEGFYESEPNSTVETADDVPLNRVFSGITYDPAGETYLLGSFMPIIDVDMLRFTLPESSRVEIDLATSGKLSYQVYDGDGMPLRQNASKDESDPYISGVTPSNKENGRQIACGVLPAGTYSMHVTGMDSDVWKKPYALAVHAVAAETPDPAPIVPPEKETRNVTLSVRGGHGTLDPAPGTYAVGKSEPYEIELIPEAGYVPGEIWVDGVSRVVDKSCTAWVLPVSDDDQTFEVKYDLQKSGTNDAYRDISKVTIYVDGVPASSAPRIIYDEQSGVSSHIVAVHHMGAGVFKRLYPENFRLGDIATYHFNSDGIDYTRIVAFPVDGTSCIVSDECRFDTVEAARYFVDNIQTTLPDVYLDSWYFGNIAYVQLRIDSGSGGREAFDSVMKAQYSESDNHLVLGPNIETDYTVSFAADKMAGNCTVTVTGIGDHFGSKTATFEFDKNGVNGDDVDLPGEANDGFRNIADTEIYVDGAPATASSQVSYVGGRVEPDVIAVHHNGSGTFKRIYPEGFDLREVAVYHYRLGSSDVTTVVAFEDGRESCIYSTEMTFPYAWMAEEFATRMREESRAGEFLDGWSVGNTAYVQQRLASNDRAASDIVMINNYGNSTNGLVFGPDAGLDYAISYENNNRPGTATAIVTGKGDCFGTKTATFRIVDKRVSGSGISGGAQTGTVNRTSTTTPLVQTGASSAGGSSSGKTGLVRTGDAVGHGAVLLAVMAAVVAIAMTRKRRAAASGAVTDSTIRVPVFAPPVPRKPVLSASNTGDSQAPVSLMVAAAKPKAFGSFAPYITASAEKTCDLICSLDELFGRSSTKGR